MRLSPSSSSCASRRRVGRAESDRSRAGSGPISVRGAVGVPGGCWLSSMLHMGGRGFCGARAGCCWNDGIFQRASCVVVGLPCAMRGVYAHGSMTTTATTTATDIAVPRDSAVPTDAGCTRVCNTHHPLHTRATRTPAEPPRGRPAHFTRPPNPKTTPPKTTPPKTTTPQTPTPVPDALTRDTRHKTDPARRAGERRR